MKPDRWLPLPKLLKRVRADSPAATRSLLQGHFEFRSGLGSRNPAWPELRQRATDLPPPVPRDTEREGRLRYAHAELYHGIEPERWLPARELRDEVLDHRRLEDEERPIWRRSTSARSGRVLPDDHFLFRFGVRGAGWPGLYTRRDDLPDHEMAETTR